MVDARTPVLEVQGLRKQFPGPRSLVDLLRRRPSRDVTAVDGVSFDILPGEVLALVGESGCGKTTTGNLLLGLLPATAGKVILGGRHVGSLSHRDLLRLRRNVQMIFQDPY
ncbi:MAG TPA: ATP-binding cassette domain-containing protein, partial [Candidatus Limnocylindria bacterium]|nr:ATP-binding cassette domain-containing protein [Candidatus Limnocylindria bacterium]